MQEIRISGVKAARCLRRAPDARALTLDAGFEDDRHEHLWRIAAITDEGLALSCEETGQKRRIRWPQVADGAVVVGPGHPLIDAVAAAADPAERALEQAVEALRPHLHGELHNMMDAPALLEAVRQAEGPTPDAATRKRQAALIAANGQWRLGARLAQSWRAAAGREDGPPQTDIDIYLARFLRESGEVVAAAEAVRRALSQRPGAGAEAVLRRQHAAYLADLFERGRRRDADLLAQADREARHAYALSANLPVGPSASDGAWRPEPEFHALFNRLKSLAES